MKSGTPPNPENDPVRRGGNRQSLHSARRPSGPGKIVLLILSLSAISESTHNALADVLVEQRRGDDHEAEEDAVEGSVDPRNVEEGFLGKPEDESADYDTDDRAEAAGHHDAADNRSRDGFQLFQVALGRIGCVHLEHLARRENRRAEGREDRLRDARCGLRLGEGRPV